MGYFKTSILDNSSSPVTKIEDYNTLRKKIEKFTNDLIKQAEDPSIVVGKVLEVVQTDKPKFRNIVGEGTSALINLQHFAYGILEKGVLKKLNKS